MKKFTLFALALVFLASCGSDDDEKGNGIQEIWLNSYTAFTPQSDYEQTSAEFYFFSANNGEEFITESKRFNGTVSEYQSLKDETFDLLNQGQIKLNNGEIIKASYSAYVSSSDTKYKSIFLPIGRYFVAAIYKGAKNGYLWLYSTKYAAKYYDVKEAYNPLSLDVVFPCDINHYGLIDWVSWNEKFNYDFHF